MTRHARATSLLVLLLVAACGDPADDEPASPSLDEQTQSLATGGTSYTFPVGSLVVPMDTTYQNGGMFKAYGLVYQLLRNGIPVSWVIKPDKTLCTAASSAACVGLPIGATDPRDFTVAATNFVTGTAISPTHAYRGGPFVIDQAHAAAAGPAITAWNAPLAAGVKVTVHVTTAPFNGFVKRQLIAAPSIAMFADGNEDIAVGYLTAAGIPDSNGNAWTAASPDLLTEIQVAGPTCNPANNVECPASPHSDGALFDANGQPRYCQMMSMHWGVNDAQKPLGREVVREYRSFLQYPVHLFAECQAVNAIENNSNPSRTIANGPGGATEAGTTATFTTTAAHGFAGGDRVVVSGVAVAGYNGGWSVASTPTATTFTATIAVAGLAGSGGGTVASYNGLFLTTTGYLIGQDPAPLEFQNSEEPFTQIDGAMTTVGGSERAYTLPAGGAYKAQDVVMITETGGPVVGLNDLWMTGYLDGQCSTLSEFCDPQFAQGKVSYLGGHQYDDATPMTANADAQGTRLFLNALMEAPCATDLGSASLALHKIAPLTTNGNQATYTITAFNSGASIAGNVVIRDTLPAGVAFVSATGGGTCAPAGAACTGSGGGVVTWNPGNVGGNQSVAVTLTVRYTTPARYNNTATATYRAGNTTFTATSNLTTTCYYAGNPAICAGGGDPAAPGCADGADNDSDGLIDFPDDPGCDSAVDASEVDVVASTTKARVLIAFDTSGSMAWNTCSDTFTGGDGSLTCPGADVSCAACNTIGCGNGIADDSRLHKVKTGISDVVNGFGEVEWGLMRFRQLPVPFSCGTVNVNKNDGGWQGAGASPCPGFAAGELLVKFDSENTTSMLAWMDGATNYPGTPPPTKDFELRGTGNTPLGGILNTARSFLAQTRAADDPLVATCRPYRVILVTDGAETCAGDPIGQAGLLFGTGDAEGRVPVHVIGFSTPLASTQLLLNNIAAAGGTTTYVAADDEVELSSAIQDIIAGTILTELCNELDDDCDGEVDEDFPDKGLACDNGAVGVCARAGVRVCDTPGGQGTHCNAPAIACGDINVPPGDVAGNCAEVCNGLDDNCNGQIDEGLQGCSCVGLPEICNGLDDDCSGVADDGPMPGVGETCGLGIGECTLGVSICSGGEIDCTAPGPGPEVCNTLDDDCDTLTDEVSAECYGFADPGCTLGGGGVWTCEGLCRTGFQGCSGGAPGACVGDVGVTGEVCNAFDDDCDGAVDEPWPTLGDACDNGQLGPCLVNGVESCDPADLTTPGHTVCTAPPVTPGIEVCNGLDDDCNGTPDDNLPTPPFGEACGQGSCGGILTCTATGEVDCVGGVCSTPDCLEVCNAEDDDCDGSVDEGILAGSCTDCCVDDCCVFDGSGNCLEDCTAYQDIGACDFGDLVCQSGDFACQGYVGPQPETCNGVDDDCDGLTDDAAVCPSPGDICLEGACVFPCGAGEFRCPFGFFCQEVTDCGQVDCDYCFPDPCVDVTCAAGSYCDSDTGDCVDLCDGVSCPAGTECFGGLCLDCFTLPCEVGELCIAEDGHGSCQPDLCLDVVCAADEYCDAGDCVPLTCEPGCADGEACVAGTCQTDLCAGETCPAGSTCRPSDGTCVPDACIDVRCGEGEVCQPSSGDCIPDSCAQIRCPEGYICELTLDDQAACFLPEQGGDLVTAAGGGCACRSSTGTPGAGLLLLLVALALGRRRRGPARQRWW